MGQDKTLSTIIKCDEDAKFGYPPDQDVIFMRLMSGMILSLTRSCQIIVVADDDSPRQMELLKPDETGPKQIDGEELASTSAPPSPSS